MKYKLSLQAAAIALVGISLAVPGLSFAASSNWNFHQQPDEGLIPLDQVEPRQITGEYTMDGHKISLEITADQKSIGIEARSRVKLTARLLKDGQPIRDITELGDPKSSPAGLAAFIKKPTISVNLTKLDGHIGLPPPDIAINQKDLNNSIDMKYQGGVCTPGYQPYWAPLYLGTQPSGEIRNQLIGEGFLSTQGAYDEIAKTSSSYGVFDFTDGKAEMEFIYGGVRTMPFVEFAMGINGFEGRLQSQLSLPFADQIGKASDSLVSEQGDGEISYRVSFSPSSLKPGKAERFTVAIQALKDGKAFGSAFQRVRVTALPLSKAARVSKISEGYDIPQDNTDKYSPLLPQRDFGQVDITVQNPGEFVVDDEINYHRAGLLYTAPYGSDEDCRTSASVEFDLIDGKGNVDFDYKGGASVNRQLSFLVQPINYFVSYPGWEDKVQVSLDRALVNKNYDWINKRKTNPTYREEKNLTYPFDSVEALSDQLKEMGCSAGINNLSCIGLYGDTFMPVVAFGKITNAIDRYAQTNYTIASVATGGGRFNFWLWVLIAHLLKIVILVVRLVILKKRYRVAA